MRKQAASPGLGPRLRPASAAGSLDSRSALALQRALGQEAAVTRLLNGERERQEESARPGGRNGPRVVSRLVDQFLYLRRESRAGVGDDEHRFVR
ncbi:hypothetical protein GCM10010231_58090 [Streptomyces sindenensis]|nr:hypothetical protein GCM10010231_58090 [Streptomyces sindenensis]